MKKLIAISAVAAFATMSFASGGPSTGNDDLRAELEQLKKEIAELKQAQAKINLKALKKQIREIKAHDAGDNIKWNVDFRTAYDIIGYKYASGTSDWNQIFSNRLWLGMGFAPTNNLVFKGLLSYYKAYGQMAGAKQGFNYFDWIVNETPNPAGELRVKEAYWLYFGESFLGADIPWTASFGRRPATDGLLASYREDQNPKSPLGHIINTEFDGASFKFNLEKVTDVSGMYFKLCMGRGMTNANVRYAAINQAPNGTITVSSFKGSEYTKVPGAKTVDLAGFIFVPYDDGQYSIHTTAFKAWNLPGLITQTMNVYDMDGNPNTRADQMYMPTSFQFGPTGDMYGAAISLLAEGIGDGINDFLDDTNFFVSFAWSKTDPSQDASSVQANIINAQNGQNIASMNMPSKIGMLGSTDKKTGTSIYAGINWPCQLIDNARVGVEYNHGSKYWRSFTYAEDTLAGSKLATRGDAYEIWFNKELIGKTLTAQVRYTYMDYDYTGSNGFFGDGGNPIDTDSQMAKQMGALEKAQDLRLYIRYRY
ncbi:hypothetical protein NitYY0826_C2022 [Nitratiruptor sp. YY08-26]|uniref:DUF3373 family protein n=1 Tax=unclassified Nitratiruptor TaxID=2624044 RepID=UPI001916BFDE|nr:MULTISPECIES: DUF3373 family protein [unclassified Nitratiruptor]BCD63132.1 hypothetical protein NitYY0813_C2020 [Nitratiruptor sp. YY08-13]BCD67067.1 hypothetical protein NitYY0826_C2022 [Nitratiruptor sp. YY08-26]